MKRNKEELVPLDFGDYLLVNHEKYRRAVYGNIGSGGQMTGGVGEDASPEAILAEYDRLGGLIIKKNGGKEYDEEGNEKTVDLKLATGCFYDFEKRKPRTDVVIKKKMKPNQTGGSRVTTDKTDGTEAVKPGARRKKKKLEEVDEDYKEE